MLLCSSPVQCAETKFAVLSDIHISLSGTDTNGRKLTKSISYLQKAVNQINESNVDFVVFAGDVIDKPDKRTLVVFAKIINKINKPVYVIHGNHDVTHISGLSKKEFYHLLNMHSKNRLKKVPAVKTTFKGPVLIFMDGVNQYIPSSGGYFKDSEYIFLEKKLKKYKNRKVIIVQHFPIVEPQKKSSGVTYQEDKYLKFLTGYNNVVAIVSGHYHAENVISQDGILHISVPALVEKGEYEEIIFDQDAKNKDFVIKTKIHLIE